MRFSVLMSIYKNDKVEYLESALKSIYDLQTLKPNEIVIVCDGKLPDVLNKVISKFQCRKKDIVKVVKLEQNLGLGEALRIGTEYCSCPYIMRMDADDISCSERFERQIEYLNKHPDTDVLGGQIAEFFVDSDKPERERIVPLEHNEIIKMSKRRTPMNHVTVCIKKQALLDVGGYKSLLLLEDYYLWLRMIVKGYRLANIDEVLVKVRVGNNFNGKRSAKIRIKGWKILQQYMYENKMINKQEWRNNMLSVFLFVNTPDKIKNWLYNHLLRKRSRTR